MTTTITFTHGAWIDGYGEIRGFHHTAAGTVYHCIDGTRWNYYTRPF